MSLYRSVRFHQAGLLAHGSSYFPHLPVINDDSGILRISSPFTAVGPLPDRTGFPFKLKMRLMNINIVDNM